MNFLGQKLRSQIPGATFNFTQPIIDTSTEMATGSSADLAIIIKGPELPKLRALAEQALGMLQHVRGAVDTSIEQEADQAQLRIVIDRQKVARYGLNVNDIQTIVEMAIGGQPVGRVYEGERSFDITVRYVPYARADATSISKILVTTKDGGKVPLGDLAEIHIQNGASIIARGESTRQISVRTNIRGRDQGGFVSEAQDKFAALISLPPGYSVEWGGQFQNLYRARRRLSFVLPVTIAIIFALLYTTFKSAKYAGLVLISVPFSMVGGIVALYLRGMHLSVSAIIGFISLFGVSVMSGVLVINEINRLCGENMPLLEAVKTGTTNQIRPVFMMIIAALLGMMPAATAHGIGSDVQKPLATVLVGGLLSTLFLTLLTMPALYLIVEERLSRMREGQ
jgi:cobalt-zinc-cadmium resistance protein CzcA